MNFVAQDMKLLRMLRVCTRAQLVIDVAPQILRQGITNREKIPVMLLSCYVFQSRGRSPHAK